MKNWRHAIGIQQSHTKRRIVWPIVAQDSRRVTGFPWRSQIDESASTASEHCLRCGDWDYQTSQPDSTQRRVAKVATPKCESFDGCICARGCGRSREMAPTGDASPIEHETTRLAFAAISRCNLIDALCHGILSHATNKLLNWITRQTAD